MLAPEPWHISTTIPAVKDVTAITTALAAVMCTHLRLGCHDDTIVVFGMAASRGRCGHAARQVRCANRCHIAASLEV